MNSTIANPSFRTENPSKRLRYTTLLAAVFGLLAMVAVVSNAQGVGISESSITPDASAILELRSATRGFLMPRNAATLGFTVTGLSFYNTTSNRLNYYGGGGWLEIPVKSDNLGVFAATTSLQLAGVLSDETGSGLLVFGTSPNLTTPNIGAATGTSLNVTGTLTAQSASNQVVLGATNTTTISATAPTASRTYTLPDFGADGVIPIGSAGNTISLTTTGATTLTLPTSGTLYGTAASSISSASFLGSLSDETGSGLAVFATSPTLTTPTITSPTINGTISGTAVLGVANGGTGQSSNFVQGGILYGASTTTAGVSVAGTAGDYLISGGTGAPTWSTPPSMVVVSSIQAVIAATAAKAAAATILVTPIYIPATITVNAIRLRVTTLLGATGDAGVYNNAGTLVLNGGSGSLTTAVGAKTIIPVQAGAARTLAPGQYYVAVTWNSTTGVIAGSNLGVVGVVNRTGTIATGGGAVLPASITPGSITNGQYLYFVSLNN